MEQLASWFLSLFYLNFAFLYDWTIGDGHLEPLVIADSGSLELGGEEEEEGTRSLL